MSIIRNSCSKCGKIRTDMDAFYECACKCAILFDEETMARIEHDLHQFSRFVTDLTSKVKRIASHQLMADVLVRLGKSVAKMRPESQHLVFGTDQRYPDVATAIARVRGSTALLVARHPALFLSPAIVRLFRYDGCLWVDDHDVCHVRHSTHYLCPKHTADLRDTCVQVSATGLPDVLARTVIDYIFAEFDAWPSSRET